LLNHRKKNAIAISFDADFAVVGKVPPHMKGESLKVTMGYSDK
jgi:hypothetical protein